MQSMVKDAKVIRLPRALSKEIKPCEACAIAKSHKLPFPRSSIKTTHPLEMIHSDVHFVSTKSEVGSTCFVTFIDDNTRFTWLYLLPSKAMVFECFLDFKVFVEKQFPYKVKILRCDGGGEYISKLFNDFCKKEEIKREFSCAYTLKNAKS